MSVAMLATGGEFHEAEVRVIGGFGLTAGVALIVALWGLRTSRVEQRVAHALVVVSALVLAIGYWWFVFVPPIIAAAVLYAGVLKQGLARELQPS